MASDPSRPASNLNIRSREQLKYRLKISTFSVLYYVFALSDVTIGRARHSFVACSSAVRNHVLKQLLESPKTSRAVKPSSCCSHNFV